MARLARLYERTGDYAAAEPLYRRALEVSRAALGEDHFFLAERLSDMARVFVATGRPLEALPLMERAAVIDDQMIGQIFSISSERRRTAFLDRVRGRMDAFLSLVLQHLREAPAAVRTAFDLVLRRKAIGAEALAAQRDAVLGGKYPALKPRLREWTALRMQIARRTLEGPGPEGLEAHQQLLNRWGIQKEHLETELARQIPEMNLEPKLRGADCRAVAHSLLEGVALVEFIRTHAVDGQTLRESGRYSAFVVRAGDPDDVRLIDLGGGGPIDRLIADFRASTVSGSHGRDLRDMIQPRAGLDSAHDSFAGLALRAAIFDGLVPALGGCKRLLLAPDGGLFLLPFEVLPTPDGRHLFDDYIISYLDCGRDVLRLGTSATGRPGAPLVVADPDFDLTAGDGLFAETSPSPGKRRYRAGAWFPWFGRNKAAPTPATEQDSGPAFPTWPTGRRSRDLDRGGFHFDRLAETRNEGRWVSTRLGVSPWLGGDAREGRLKSACRSPWILHMATHGFFLPDQWSDPTGEGPSPMVGLLGGPDRLSGPLPENPLLRSGLALAGANTWLKGGSLPHDAEDGLLTAEDVSGLDLTATELVVLSACETGLGEIRTGEGVFGLRRAFILAGARTLVMSLWKVPDELTRRLMEEFYCRVLSRQGRAAALREAQLALRAEYPDPYHWGAFVCLGDPAPLCGSYARRVLDSPASPQLYS